MFGIADYSVDLVYRFHGPDDVMGLCFECGEEMNMSDGFGNCYLPRHYWQGRDYTSIAYCQPCFRLRCKNHVDFNQETEIEKLHIRLSLYWKKTVGGRLVTDINKHSLHVQ